ncbi:MAG TPA: hypothetical protein VNZ47_11320 [Candidatus Dormibacteraeota bacterium]|jgi:hypothetical protein|nr:hypothetical protein [Candidatus Dormibacteraeota bacterium]
MKRVCALFVCLAFLGVASARDGGEKEARNLFEFNRLTAVVPPFTGPANPIRGIGGAGAPWQIGSGNAEFKTSGELEVNVRGLVIVRTGANPVATFSFILSCQSKDAAGAPSVVNLVAGTAPATTAGDANFEGTVTPPSPCIAPIVFVAIPATATAPARWLAVSGF